jgi:List-Bact-rpt repeat protein
MPHTLYYEGNGSTGGSVSPASYDKGRRITVSSNKDGFVRRGATFAYWNTKRDGSGTFYGWLTKTTFTMPDADVTLYAQWFVTTGLKEGGKTAHYVFSYDETLATDLRVEPDRTNKLIDDCERDYALMSGWFGGKVTLDSVINAPITRLPGGADNRPERRKKARDDHRLGRAGRLPEVG